MGQPLQTGNAAIVSAFRSQLGHDTLLLLLVGMVLLLAWNAVLARRVLRGAAQGGRPVPVRVSEHPARLVLRIGFGALWVLDGLLQLQPAMPLGLPGNVVQPAPAASPGWVQHLVNAGVTIWSDHPVQAAAATVWIQLGIGLLLLFAPRGRLSRLAGATSVVWGLLVWAFGEAFGGIFGAGASWMFGAPGAALLYCAGGLLLALPDRAFEGRRLGRGVLAGGGLFLLGMALLQAWPGRGFWQGQVAAMASQMAGTPQPHWLASWLTAFSGFDSAHGFAVNLVVVAVLGASGAALLTGRRRLVLGGLLAYGLLSLADWVLVQDLGFLGGTGTDPNSMLPTLLLLAAAYVALVHPAVATAPAVADEPALPPPTAGWRPRLAAALSRRSAAYLAGVLGTVAAAVVTAVGVVPMALAAANPNADPILAVAADGPANLVDAPAPPFRLTDQHGHPVSLADLQAARSP